MSDEAMTAEELAEVEKLVESIKLNPIGKEHSGYCGDHETFKLTCQHTDRGGMNGFYADAIIQAWNAVPILVRALRESRLAVEKYGRHKNGCTIEGDPDEQEYRPCTCGFSEASGGGR